MQLVSVYTDVRLDEAQVAELSSCVQLSPKFSNLYHTKLLVQLVTELDEKAVAGIQPLSKH